MLAESRPGHRDVLLWFTDLEGHLKSFSITPDEVEGALDDGMGFDGSSITGFNAIEESDMVAIPDPTTFGDAVHTGESKVGRMICDVVTPDGEPYEGDPRYVLRRALERMEAMGFDTFNVGPEVEYFLFKDEKGTETLDEGGYFAQTTLDAATELRHDTIRALESMGIPVEYHHHEVGPSQHEIDIRFADALDMADYMLTYRLIVKEVAEQERRLRDLHAEAALRRERLGHAHAPVALHRRPQRVLRRGRQVAPLRRRQGVHRRPAPPRARDLGGVRAVGELVQAARAGLRGAGLRRLVAAEPLGADPDPALQAGLGAGDARRDPLPGSGVQPVPHLRGLLHAGLEGIEQGYELPDPMETNLYHLTAEQRRERGHRLAAGDARRGDRRALAVGARAEGARPAHLRPLRRAEAEGVGRVPRPAHRLGDEAVPRTRCSERRGRALSVGTGATRVF